MIFEGLFLERQEVSPLDIVMRGVSCMREQIMRIASYTAFQAFVWGCLGKNRGSYLSGFSFDG